MLDTSHRSNEATRSAVLCELGVLGVHWDGEWAAVRGSRASALVAALGLAGDRGVRAEELVEVIWPSDGQPSTARQSLRNIVMRLRKDYGEWFIESTRNGYRIGEEVGSDRRRFLDDVEQAEALIDRAPDRSLALVDRALMRWRGEPWVGIERPAAVEADRAQLLDVHTTALRLRATALIALDREEQALSVLGEVLDIDPYDESSRIQLVRVLSSKGRRAEAVTVIREAHRLFSARGLVLDGELVGLEQELLRETFNSNAEMAPLPEQPTDFVGRLRELEEVAGLLSDHRLVTLYGAGGSGKTRLAVHACGRMGGSHTCGFVDLTAAETSTQVELAFALGLGLPLSRLDGLDSHERREVLAEEATWMSGILVIDNCEHVVHEVRIVVQEMLARAGRLRMLATSRVPLEVSAECVYPLPSFEHGSELFGRRSAQRGVFIDEGSVDTVARICALVDELPLAIEIAAAQTPYRSVREIADELELGIEHRDRTQRDPRHETMAAAIVWSRDLLDTDAADAFIRLGVFVDSFEENDADAVVDHGNTRRILDSLVRHSLLERAEREGRSTYRLPVPVQQYCIAELRRIGITTEVSITLAGWLLAFTNRPYGEVWWHLSVIDEIKPRVPHALSAIAALRTVGRVDDATRLASRLGGIAHRSGYADDLIELLSDLIPGCDDAGATADALVALVECADASRRNDVMSTALGMLDALEGPIGRQHGAYVHCRNSLWIMWAARLTDEDYGAANDQLRQARDQRDPFGRPINRAMIEMWQSGVDLLAGDWAGAESAARRSLDDAIDTHHEFFATSSLCHALLQQGDPTAALELATSRAYLDRSGAHGDLLGTVAAIARVQTGDTATGLADMTKIQHRARQTHFRIQQDDAAIAIAYIAHLLHHDDLTVQILETGTIGYGPWIGYLVPKICRDLHIPLAGQGNYRKSVEERHERSDHYGIVATRVLNQLHERHAKDSARPNGT